MIEKGDSMNHFEAWQPIRSYYECEQPRTGRHLNHLPAWDVTAICRQPDGEIPRKAPACEEGAKGYWPAERANKVPFEEVRQYVYWNRHVDRRFHIEYPHASKDCPRDQGATVTNPDREWDTFVAMRDKWLAGAGLTPDSPKREVAKRLAELWLFENFDKRPTFSKFAKEPRQINHPLDALLNKSWCIGASQSFMALMDSLGLPARGIGSQGHRTAETLIDGRWYYAESSMRHGGESMKGNDALIPASHMELALDPWADYGANLTDHYRGSLWWHISGWYHFVFGTWTAPHAMLFSAQNMAALYPGAKRYGIKTFDPERLVILNRSCSGFCWPRVNGYPTEDFHCHRFLPGQRLRESVWLNCTDDIQEMELLFTFDLGARECDFSDEAGKGLIVQIGGFRKSLYELGAWPPKPGKELTQYPVYARKWAVVAKVPKDAFTANGLTWIELHHEGRYPFAIPCVPAVMEPYIAPLWAETEDAFGPALPDNTTWELAGH
jgi:hypothetical protein